MPKQPRGELAESWLAMLRWLEANGPLRPYEIGKSTGVKSHRQALQKMQPRGLVERLTDGRYAIEPAGRQRIQQMSGQL